MPQQQIKNAISETEKAINILKQEANSGSLTMGRDYQMLMTALINAKKELMLAFVRSNNV